VLRSLVGRVRELADLEQALIRAVAGHGNLVMLSGEPGIGKTRLAEEIAERAEQLGAQVVWGRAWEVSGGPACGPWLPLLRACGAGDALVAMTGDPESALVKRGAAVVALLRQLAAERPVILVFDDLHAANVSSLALLAHVARELRGLRVLIIGTHREVEARRAPQVAALLAQSARAGAARPLGRLDAGAVAAWIAAALGAESSPALAAAVHAATEGNPLFVDAVVQLICARGQGELAPGFALPGSIRAAVDELVSLVPGAARGVLDCAAVLGRECSIAALQLLCAQPVDEVLAALDAAIAAGVVEPQPRPSQPVRFVHVLVREAIYQDLPAARRIELHARAGAALQQLHAGEPVHLAELAHHAFEGAPVGSWAEAARLSAQAGQRALGLGAFDDAAEHLDHALIALGRSGSDAPRIALLIQLGEAQIRIGQTRAGRDHCERAAVLAAEAGAADLHAQAALTFGLELVPGHIDARLIELLEAALRLAPEPVLRIRVMARLAAAMLPAAQPARALALARDAITRARGLGDRRALAQVLVAARAAFTPAQPLEELQAIDREVVALAGELGDRLLAVQAHGRLALVAMAQGEPGEVALQLDLQHRLAEQLGVPQHQMRVASLRLMWATARGDEAAIAAAEHRIRELADRIDDARGLMVLEANRCARAELAGDAAAAGAALERLERLLACEPLWAGSWRPVWRASSHVDPPAPPFGGAAARGQAPAVDHGRLDEARAEVALIAPDLLDEPFAAAGPALLVRLARIAVGLGRRDWMPGLLARLEPHAAQMALNGAVPVCDGPVAYYLGRLAAGLGDVDAAAAHLRDALARAQRAGFPAYAELAQRALAALPVAGVRPTASAGVESPPRLERDGELWVLSHGSRRLRLKDSKGLAYLAALLDEPGREFHVGDLVARSGELAAMSEAAARADGLTIGGPGDAGELLDARARAGYRQRLERLRDALDDAEQRSDRAAIARIRAEREQIADELARAVGLGGRARRAGAAAERARINVQRRIRDVLTRIADVDAPLARYLDHRVKTGSFCSFDP
jgi:hypothetical protein